VRDGHRAPAGGSTIVASKVIAAAVRYDGDPRDMVFHGQANVHIPTEALPILAVPTLAATGSEMNGGAVITNEETTEKSLSTPHASIRASP
jgi:alcohol dehydrogenase YqhD (iron-dependent ADH family)